MDSLKPLRRFLHVVAIVVAIAGLIDSATAAMTHTVGDSTGWRIPSAAQFYANWASGKTFTVGDTLIFNFNALQHDVAQVTKADYDACTANNPIGSIIRSSPGNITLNSTGSHYYLCTISSHCNAGQKLDVNVVALSTAAPATAPSVSPTPSPTPGISPSTPSPAPNPSPALTVSTPSPSPATGVSPGPAPTPTASSSPSPTAPSGPAPTSTASSSPSPSPTSPSGSSPSPPLSNSPSSPPTAPSTGSQPPTPSSSPTNEPTGTSPPATTEGPPAPSTAFSLRTSSRAMAFSSAILFAFFI